MSPATTFSIAGNSVIEPAPNGTVNLDFTITRNGDLTSQVTIGYTTVAGTARPNTDFTPTTGTTTFASGSPTSIIAIPIFGNGVYNNPSLTFSVRLTGITNVVGPPVTFGARADSATGAAVYSVAVADFNGDGKPDLVIANFGSNTVSVLLNTTAPGAAAATFAPKVDFTTAAAPISVAVADINGDGRPDLLVVSQKYGSVSVLLNTTAPGSATPTFTPRTEFGLLAVPVSVVVGDFNGDGKTDLAFASRNSASVLVLLNTTATGSFTPSFGGYAILSTGSYPASAAVGDINGDGKPDLVVGNQLSDSVSVFLNTTPTGASSPTFAVRTDFATGMQPLSVAIGDLNGDGKLDLIIADEGSNTASVLLNTTAAGATTPTFGARQAFAVATNPLSVAVADLNGDGKLDLIVANATDNNTSVLLNTTATGATVFTFAAQQIFDTGAGPRSVVVADLNGDGKPDLVLGNSEGYASVLLNTTVVGAAAVVPDFPQAAAPAVSSNPYSVAVGDLNGDGKPDLVVANLTSNTVSVLLNTTAPGATTPTFAAEVDFAVGSQPISVAIADLNGDGLPDLVVANFNDSNGVSVLLNTTAPGAAAPSFSAHSDFRVGTAARSVAVADVNGDGLPDLVVANEASNSVSVLLNMTSPGMAPAFAAAVSFATGQEPVFVAVADLNGDGKPDLVVANYFTNNVSVLLNNTAAGSAELTFSGRTDFATGAGPFSVAVGDLNGDGRPDLAVVNRNSYNASVLLNTTAAGASTPSFASQQTFATGATPTSVAIADLNGDGKLDLVVANKADNTVSELLNTTAPGAAVLSFAPKADFTAGTRPVALAIRDLNGDGRPDVAVAAYGSNTVSVLLNTPATITAAAAVGTITESDSPPFANKIVFLRQPGDGVVLQPLTQVVVQVLDQYGNPVTTGNVTLTVAAGSPGDFDSVSTVSAPMDSNGVADFGNLILDVAGMYTLTAGYGGQISAASSGFTASAAALSLSLNGSQVTSNVPRIAAGASFDFGASFIDQGAVPLQEIVTWGDGSFTRAPITVSNQQGQFVASHIYTGEGSFFVNVTIVDGQGRVVGVGALPGPVQVIPDTFGAVNVVYGVPGQTVTQSVVDPSTGTVTTISLTLPVGSAGGGYLLVAPLKTPAKPSPAGAALVRTSFDLRQFNLPEGATATVTITFFNALHDGTAVQLLYLDTKTDPSSPVERVFQGPVQPVRANSVTFGLSQFTTPQLTDLSGTVFTVVASVPAQTAAVAISPPLASNAVDATAPVQTAAFRTTSSLTLTLEPTQAGQVSSTLSMFSTDAVGGGGGVPDEESASANALLQFLLDKLEFLPRFLFHGDAPAAGPTSSSPAPPAAPEPSLSPNASPENVSALDIFLSDPAPSLDRVTPMIPLTDSKRAGRPPRIEQRNPAAFAAAAALGLTASYKQNRRKGRRAPADGLK